jgi:hypothetical protein
VEERLRGRALRPEIDQSRQQDAGVEENAHGQRFRSSSIRASTSITGRLSGGTVGRATRRCPTRTSRGPGAALESNGARVHPPEISSSEAANRPVPGLRPESPPACLVDGSSHAIMNTTLGWGLSPNGGVCCCGTRRRNCGCRDNRRVKP